jgi:hypothetical protein
MLDCNPDCEMELFKVAIFKFYGQRSQQTSTSGLPIEDKFTADMLTLQYLLQMHYLNMKECVSCCIG